jgi:hypothetical protein
MTDERIDALITNVAALAVLGCVTAVAWRLLRR